MRMRAAVGSYGLLAAGIVLLAVGLVLMSREVVLVGDGGWWMYAPLDDRTRRPDYLEAQNWVMGGWKLGLALAAIGFTTAGAAIGYRVGLRAGLTPSG